MEGLKQSVARGQTVVTSNTSQIHGRSSLPKRKTNPLLHRGWPRGHSTFLTNSGTQRVGCGRSGPCVFHPLLSLVAHSEGSQLICPHCEGLRPPAHSQHPRASPVREPNRMAETSLEPEPDWPAEPLSTPDPRKVWEVNAHHWLQRREEIPCLGMRLSFLKNVFQLISERRKREG